MSPREPRIRAYGAYCEAVRDAPPDLRELTKEAAGKGVRRIGRFIQLSLIGAARCVGDAQLGAQTGVYLGSRRGDLEVTVEVLEHVFRDGHAPKPLSFINTVSNAACFYVARRFGLEGPSMFIGGDCFAFEQALQAALMDFETGAVRSALVGGVEMVTAPVEEHRRRLKLAADTPVAEASHWLLLDADGDGARAGDIAFFAEREALADWIAAQCFPGATLFAAGQFLSAADAAWLAQGFALSAFRAGLGYYDCQAAAAVGAFVAQDAPALLHVNADADGRYCAMVLRR